MNYLLALMAAILIAAAASPAPAQIAVCSHINGSGHINVLTINILYTDFSGRSDRLQAVADFIAGQEDNETADIILLQEVVSGALAGTLSLSYNLKVLLEQKGLLYNLRQRPVAGLPGVFMVGNAMLSRCAITEFASRLLPYAGESPFGGPGFPVLHEVQKIGIDVPGYGAASIYNTHLCAYCGGWERLRQMMRVRKFMFRHELAGESRLILLGGDFNLDLNRVEDLPAYGIATTIAGFTDSYADANGCRSCCSETEGLEGCTYAVPGNTLAEGEPAQRIDYIFVQGDFTTVESRVVFNEAPWVSDHSGVLTKVNLP